MVASWPLAAQCIVRVHRYVQRQLKYSYKLVVIYTQSLTLIILRVNQKTGSFYATF